MRKQHKSADGKYHIGNQVFENLVGSRAQVHHGTAYKTSGNLLKKDLVQNRRGRIVSRRKRDTATAEKRLEQHGFFADKGKFGAVKRTPKAVHRSQKRKTMRRKMR